MFATLYDENNLQSVFVLQNVIVLQSVFGGENTNLQKVFEEENATKCLLQVDRKKHPPPRGISLLGGFQTNNLEEEDPPLKTTPIFFKIGVVFQGVLLILFLGV